MVLVIKYFIFYMSHAMQKMPSNSCGFSRARKNSGINSPWHARCRRQPPSQTFAQLV